ncbi:MAG: hypothetical protein JKY93_01170 [Gammaproteobacteria bacterium]|nr:hypothetical protein [Gammaproteobacteria bacterium]
MKSHEAIKILPSYLGTIWASITLDQIAAAMTAIYTALLIGGWVYDRFIKKQ